MAAIFIIAGGIVGFASALASLVLLEASLLLALGIWSGTGLLALGLGIGVALATQRRPRQDSRAQTAV